MIETEWFLLTESGQTGPYSADQVRSMLAAGEIDSATQAWSEGIENWMALADLPDFAPPSARIAVQPEAVARPASWSDDSEHDLEMALNREQEQGRAAHGGRHWNAPMVAAVLVVIALLGLFAYRIWGPSRRVVPVALKSISENAEAAPSAADEAPVVETVATTALIELPAVPPVARGKKLAVTILDVGQGDAILLRLPSGAFVLYDAGIPSPSRIVPYLQSLGVTKLKALVISHPHADHVGGAFAVLANFDVGAVYDCGASHPIKTYTAVLQEIEKQGIAYYQPRAGEILDWDPNVRVAVLHPDRSDYPNLNDNSIVLHVAYGATSVLLTGDAERDAEARIVKTFGDQIKADVLKVGHHGSRSSSTKAFLRASSPAIAVISCGRANSHGHPHAETLKSFSEMKATVLRTDQSGYVLIESDGSSIRHEATPNPFPVVRNPGAGALAFTDSEWSEAGASESNVVVRKTGECRMTVTDGGLFLMRSIPSGKDWEFSVGLEVDGGNGSAGVGLVTPGAGNVTLGMNASGEIWLWVAKKGEPPASAGSIAFACDKVGFRRKGANLEIILRDKADGKWRQVWTVRDALLDGKKPSHLNIFARTMREKTTAVFHDAGFSSL